MAEATPILEFADVTVERGSAYDSALFDVCFQLWPGQLMLVHLEAGHLRLPLADAAEGLAELAAGRVLFGAEDWSGLSETRAAMARGTIGRVFDEPGWLSELNIDENVTLAQRHHTGRPEAEIRDEAAALARLFSLPGLPTGRAAGARRHDLRRAACVRAFLGQPLLIILERPTAGVYPEIMPPLMTSIRAAQARGAALIWTTDDRETWNDRGIRPTFRCSMSGSQMRISTSTPGK